MQQLLIFYAEPVGRWLDVQSRRGSNLLPVAAQFNR